MNEYAEILKLTRWMALWWFILIVAWTLVNFVARIAITATAANRVGSRSLLYGAHCFFIHPWFVALAWWKLYRFPWDPRLWIAFIIHDWGYWGCSNMDGEEGEQHPYWAAGLAHKWMPGRAPGVWKTGLWRADYAFTWFDFFAYHSRFLAKQVNAQPSMLCWADKYAFALEPWWLYLPRARATGELAEYLGDGERRYGLTAHQSERDWHRKAQARMARVAFAGAAEYYASVDNVVQRLTDEQPRGTIATEVRP